MQCVALAATQLALVAAYGGDVAEDRGRLSAADFKFAREAASGGLTEVTLGQLAAEKSTNPEVQQFGKRMVTDHGKANQDLRQIAIKNGATLPAEPLPMHQKEIDRLGKLSGAEFDKAYVALMVRDHKADVKEFKKASENAQDADLKAFAARTLAVIQEHLNMAENLEAIIRHELSQNQ